MGAVKAQILFCYGEAERSQVLYIKNVKTFFCKGGRLAGILKVG
ncbi:MULTISPECIES: hypothetical protein [Treponema]|nr:hypothetical protein [Treponema peruense]